MTYRPVFPVMSRVETKSIAEITFLKEELRRAEVDCMAIKSTIHVVDRAFRCTLLGCAQGKTTEYDDYSHEKQPEVWAD